MTNANNTAERNSNERLRGARSEVRTDKVREKQFEPFRPRGAQEIPAALEKLYADKGYHLHWVRMIVDEKPDTANLADVRHKGYTPLDMTEIPENIKRTLNIGDIAGFSNMITSKDTALWQIPLERYREIRRYYENVADSQIKGVHDQIRESAKMHGLEVKLHDESKSIVSYGKDARKAMVQEDSKPDTD